MANQTPWGAGAPRQQLNPSLFSGQLGVNPMQAAQFQSQQMQASLSAVMGGQMRMPAFGAGMNANAFSQPNAQMLMNQPIQAAARMPGILPQVQQQLPVAAAVQSPAAVAGGQRQSRAFVGQVTKLQDNYGFVDDDVFFQHNVVRGQMPRVGDRVMCEANYNANMPFKWNAFRIQLLQEPAAPTETTPSANSGGTPHTRTNRWDPAPANQPATNGFAADPYPTSDRGNSRRDDRRASPPARYDSRDRDNDRSYSGRRADSPVDRRPPIRRASPPIRRHSPPPRRDAPTKRARSPSPRRHESVVSNDSSNKKRHDERSPPRQRARVAPSNVTKRSGGGHRHEHKLPRVVIDQSYFTINVPSMRDRYPSMYVPSDVMHAEYNWPECVRAHRPLPYLQRDTHFHVLNKMVAPLHGDSHGQPIDPPDADHSWQAKVMLLASPPSAELFAKCVGLQADGQVDDKADTQSVNRALQFLVGMRGKNEVLCIGGAWSPSLDGGDPSTDPSVLVRTAKRTTLAMTGIDLQPCSQWFKFVTVRYGRIDEEKTHDGGDENVALDTPTVHTTVIFVPDVWNLQPSSDAWTANKALIGERMTTASNDEDAAHAKTTSENEHAVQTAKDRFDAATLALQGVDERRSKVKEEVTARVQTAAAGEEGVEETNEDDDTAPQEPTHWSKLDVVAMKVTELRVELEARGQDKKGLKAALVERLQTELDKEKAADSGEAVPEANKEETTEAMPSTDDQLKIVDSVDDAEDEVAKDPSVVAVEAEHKAVSDEHASAKKAYEGVQKQMEKKKVEDEKRHKSNKEDISKAYAIASTVKPSILVHPHPDAKNGKLECKLMSLHALLDYRADDNKEYSFEVSLFAETFADMLTRDAAFAVYKMMLRAPTKAYELKMEEAKKAMVEGKTEETTEGATKEKEEGGEQPMDTTDDKEEEKPKKMAATVSVVRDSVSLLAFSHFDAKRLGYVSMKDAEHICYSLGLSLTRSQLSSLIKRISLDKSSHRSLGDILHYRRFTDAKVTKDTLESVDEPVLMPLTIAADALATDQLSSRTGVTQPATFWNQAPTTNTTPASTNQTTVMYEGSLVDVPHTMQLLSTLQADLLAKQQEHTDVQAQLLTVKDARDTLAKRKHRLDGDVERYRKKLSTAETKLRLQMDSTGSLTTTIADCRKLADRITRTIDATTAKNKKKEEAALGKSTKDDVKKEDKSAATSPTKAGTVAVTDSTSDDAAKTTDSAMDTSEGMQNGTENGHDTKEGEEEDEGTTA